MHLSLTLLGSALLLGIWAFFVPLGTGHRANYDVTYGRGEKKYWRIALTLESQVHGAESNLSYPESQNFFLPLHTLTCRNFCTCQGLGELMFTAAQVLPLHTFGYWTSKVGDQTQLPQLKVWSVTVNLGKLCFSMPRKKIIAWLVLLHTQFSCLCSISGLFRQVGMLCLRPGITLWILIRARSAQFPGQVSKGSSKPWEAPWMTMAHQLPSCQGPCGFQRGQMLTFLSKQAQTSAESKAKDQIWLGRKARSYNRVIPGEEKKLWSQSNLQLPRIAQFLSCLQSTWINSEAWVWQLQHAQKKCAVHLENEGCPLWEEFLLWQWDKHFSCLTATI